MRGGAESSDPFVAALADAGHELVDDSADVTLAPARPGEPSDGDMTDLDTPIVVFPAAPGPPSFIDFMGERSSSVTARVVVGGGAAEALRAAGYPAEVVAVGWPYGELRPFRPAETGRVLFIPVAPTAHGHLPRELRAANRAALDALTGCGAEVTVRHVDSLRAHGLVWRPDVEFTPARSDDGEFRPPEVDIDAADIVVAAGAAAYLAVSRGAPTAMFGQRRWGVDYSFAGQPLFRRRWSATAPDVHYPYELFDNEPAETLARAGNDDSGIVEWRRRFIGDPFDPAAFVADIDRIVAEARR